MILGGTNPAVTFPDATVQNTAGLPLTGGNLSGSIAFTASNAGITFANSSALANSQLNDYETGTWTVTDQSGAGLSLVSNTGTYTKIGRVVYYAFDVQFPTTANTTNVKLSLPITGQTGLGGSSGAGAIGYCNIGSTGITAYMGFPTNLAFYTMTSGIAVTNANLSSKELSVAGFYIASF